MSFSWPWRKPKIRVYSSLQQDEELDSETCEKREVSRPAIHSLHRLFYALSLLVNTTLLCFVALIYLQGITWPGKEKDQRLYNSPIPQFPREIKTFSENPIYMDRPSEESDAAWEALGGPPTEHPGFIFIENPENYNLAYSPSEDSAKEMFGVSMLHQLHCLGAIRHVFWGVLEGTVDPQKLLEGYPRNASEPSPEATIHGLWHISHCFDYIRQALQCAGDMSLEWPVDVHGEKLVVGWYNPHECRSWDAAWEFVEKHS